MIQKIANIIRSVLEDSTLMISENSEPADFAAWDSLHHVMIIAEIEQTYHIKFGFMEMIEFKTVGDICKSIENKL